MKPFANRRQILLEQMAAAGGGVAILPTAPEHLRNNDAEYPYRHDSSFFYLTGFMEPEAVLVLVADQGRQQSILFCREKNPEREVWDGYRYGPAAARSTFGFDASFSFDAIDTEMRTLLAGQPRLFCSLGQDASWDARLFGWLAQVKQQRRSGVLAPEQIHELRPLVHAMRLFKDSTEISSMQRAADIAAGAHARAMRHTRPGMHEYQIEAELLHEFRRHGAEGPAYTSIVASGANACVLHYRAGNALLRDGELVLIDAGCEFDSYASDISRTYPVNGRFSGAQKQLYEIVLAAQAAAIDALRPGSRFTDSHDAALKILAQGMLDTGLLKRDLVGSLEDVIAKGDYRQFYMHSTGHWLGLDVHDVGDYRDPIGTLAGPDRPSRQLMPGMVTTVEPGLYVRPGPDVPEAYWNIGIRIEDDVLITEQGHTVLSNAAPKTVADIESLMRQSGA